MREFMYLAATNLDLDGLPRVNDNIFEIVLRVAIAVTAALSLLFITIGGFRYVLSQGDPGAISKAKGTIVYALVGLAIAIVAQALVTFVLGNI